MGKFKIGWSGKTSLPKIAELRPEGNEEGGSCVSIWGKSIPGRRKRNRGFEEGACLAYSGDSKEPRAAGAKRAEREMRAEIEGVSISKVF